MNPTFHPLDGRQWSTGGEFWSPGISLRDWFAGMALQAIVANQSWNQTYFEMRGSGSACHELAAELAIRYADAMIACLKNKDTPK